MPNDLLAELAQIENIVAVKQANPANLAKVDGLPIYAGNDDLLADVLDLGEAGGILTGSHLFGDEMRRMVDEPEHRHEIDAGLQDVYRDLGRRAGRLLAQGRAAHDRPRRRRPAPALRRARAVRAGRHRGDAGTPRPAPRRGRHPVSQATRQPGTGARRIGRRLRSPS